MIVSLVSRFFIFNMLCFLRYFDVQEWPLAISLTIETIFHHDNDIYHIVVFTKHYIKSMIGAVFTLWYIQAYRLFF